MFIQLALSSKIVFLFCCFVLYVNLTLLLCLLFDVRLSHLINITYIDTYIDTYRSACGLGPRSRLGLGLEGLCTSL